MPMIKHHRLLSYLIGKRGVHHADAIMSLPIAEENFISICFHYFPTVRWGAMDRWKSSLRRAGNDTRKAGLGECLSGKHAFCPS